jgi:hypothetical protein
MPAFSSTVLVLLLLLLAELLCLELPILLLLLSSELDALRQRPLKLSQALEPEKKLSGICSPLTALFEEVLAQLQVVVTSRHL